MAIRMKPGTKKAFIYSVIFLIFYWIALKKRRITETFELTIHSVDPKTMWEYWADFSNFQKINPTIIDFEIDYEKGTYENWEYGVTYLEHLTMLPFNVYMKSKYIVTPEQKRGHFSKPFTITSEHDACVGLFCIHSDAEMTFLTDGNQKNTKIVEITSLECSPIMNWYQRGEFRRQKEMISDQLRQIDFSTFK